MIPITFSVSKYAKSSLTVTGDKYILDKLNELIAVKGFETNLAHSKNHRISITVSNSSYVVDFMDRKFQAAKPLQFIQNIAHDITYYADDILPLHAGAIVNKGKADVFFSSTGSGKTTLVSYLCEQGYSYMSDDSVYINMKSLLLNADVKPIHLRLSSIPILQNYGCTIIGEEIVCEDFHRIVYMPENHLSTDIPINKLYYIIRNENCNRCYKLPPAEATPLIMENILTPNVDAVSCLRCAVKLANRCYQLTYSDLNFVKEIVHNG